MLATTLLALLFTTVELPFTLHRQHNVPVIDVTVNGRTAHLIVDTGCSLTLIADDVAQRSAPPASFLRRDGTGLEVNGRYWEVDLDIGGKRWTKRMVGVVDFSRVRDQYGKDIDGLLGQDVLREFESIHIDYRSRKLTLEKP